MDSGEWWRGWMLVRCNWDLIFLKIYVKYLQIDYCLYDIIFRVVASLVF